MLPEDGAEPKTNLTVKTGSSVLMVMATEAHTPPDEAIMELQVVKGEVLELLEVPLEEGEVPEMKQVRFRTLGCYPLTGAVESAATTLPEVIQEMLLATRSEREGRLIDGDADASMEEKKREGYF